MFGGSLLLKKPGKEAGSNGLYNGWAKAQLTFSEETEMPWTYLKQTFA